MARPKGQGKTPGSGRQPGTPNKTTLAAKEAFQYAFDAIGGGEALAKWARQNPTEFYKIYGRLIPHDVALKTTAFPKLIIECG